MDAIPGATHGFGIALTCQFLRTTNLPVYAFHRVATSQLTLLKLNPTSENSIASATQSLSELLGQKNFSNVFIHTAFITGRMRVDTG